MKVNFMIAATMLCVIESVAQEVVPDSTVTRDLQEVVVDAKSAYTSAVKSTYIRHRDRRILHRISRNYFRT